MQAQESGGAALDAQPAGPVCTGQRHKLRRGHPRCSPPELAQFVLKQAGYLGAGSLPRAPDFSEETGPP